MCGEREEVWRGLLRGEDINQRDSTGRGVLSYAAEYGWCDMVSWLVTRGANVNEVDAFTRSTPLTRATVEGHECAVRLLAEHGADVNVVESDGYSALHYAAERGCEGNCIILLEHGAKVDATTKTGRVTPLHLAGSTEVALLLIAAGADVNAKDSENCTPLHYAVFDAGFCDDAEDIGRVLLKAGADPSLRDDSGKTAMDYAVADSQAKFISVLQEFQRVPEVRKEPTP
jgi:ankyrin repeat protein